MTDSELVVKRWRRFGHDRLYVSDPSGAALGWWDLRSDTCHASSPQLRDVVSRAAARWRDTGRPSRAAPADVPPAPPSAAPPSAESWHDLTLNVPGSAARRQAEAHRSAAPVRTALARLLRVHTPERAWRLGADGEELVAARLATLARKDPRWRVLHAVPVGSRGSDVDHVVIGPGGVFTLNTKHHPGARVWVGGDVLLVDGRRQPYVHASRYEAQRASRLLTACCRFPVPVTAVIVPVGAERLTVRSRPEGVHVVGRRSVARWLHRTPECLHDEAVDAIFGAARRSTTWTADRTG